MPSRKKSNSPGSRAVIVVMLAALVGVAGFAAYVKFTPGASRVADDLRRKDEISRPGPSVDVDSKPSTKTTDAAGGLKVPALVGSDVQLTKSVGSVPAGEDPQAYLLTQTFKAMGVSDGRALKVVVDGGTAQVEVNQAVVEHGYGSMEEGYLIKALQLALGQFSTIDRFTLVEGGNPVEFGHLDLSEPIEVIRPGQTPEQPADGEG